MVFTNGVLDLEINKFGSSKLTDYISDEITCGVLYEERDEVKIEYLYNVYLAKMFPDRNIMNAFLSHLATGLNGYNSKFL